MHTQLWDQKLHLFDHSVYTVRGKNGSNSPKMKDYKSNVLCSLAGL